MELSKKQKKKLLNEYKNQNQKNYYLNKNEAIELFAYLEETLEKSECDKTLKNTKKWLKEHIADEKRCNFIIKEIKDNGGFCDCEVLNNCYEDYDI